jgi:signal peptidase I
MNWLKKQFEALHAKFVVKKPLFEKVIEKWKHRGKTTWHERGKAILDELEKESSELKNLFADASSSISKSEIKIRLKRFRKNLKKLTESTKPSWRQWTEALVVAGIVALILRHFIFGLYHVPSGSAEPTILVGDRVWGNKLAYFIGPIKRGDLVIFDNPDFKYEDSGWLQRKWQKHIGFPIPLLGLKTGPINMVKRVIAVPGDWIEGRIENGKTVIYLNNEKLSESYVNPYPLIWLDKKVGFLPFSSIGPIPIPYFLREQSIPYGFWCTYVPGKSFDEQPYYNMKKDEVIKIPGLPFLREAYSPSIKDPTSGKSADVFGPMRVPEGKYWVMGDSRKNSRDSRWFGFLDKKYVHGRLSFIIYSIDSQESFWLFGLLKHPIDFWLKAIRWNRFIKIPKSVATEK